MSISLRWFQKEANSAIESAWAQGNKAVLVSIPTGGGKTIIFSSLFEKVLKGTKGRGLILVHRDALLQQSVEKLNYVWPEVSVGKVIAGTYEFNKQITVASVQTLHGKLPELIDSCKMYGPITHMVTDEAHHAVASTWRDIYSVLYKEFAPLHLGVTATPIRSNKKEKLSNIFKDIVYSVSIFQLIKEGFLAPIRCLNVATDLDLSKVEIKHGDYNIAKLSKTIDLSNFNEMVVEGWVARASDRKTICFAVDVKHVDHLVSMFNDAGAKAVGIHGKIPRPRQREILEGFSNGTYNILVNCEILTEGFDCPAVDCVLMARPTFSLGLFVQMVGRGLRLYPGKTDCLIIDYTDNCKEHKLITMQDLLGFYGLETAQKYYKKRREQRVKGKGKTYTGEREKKENKEQKKVGKELKPIKKIRDEIEFKEDDFNITPETISEIEAVEKFGGELSSSGALTEIDIFDINKFAWQELDDNWFVSARKNLTIGVCKNTNGKYVPYIINTEDRWVAPISAPVDYEFALAIANVYLFDYGDRKLACEESEWRYGQPSESQVSVLRKAASQYKFKTVNTSLSIHNIPATRGDYSKVLTALFGSAYIQNNSKRISIEQATDKLKQTILADLYGKTATPSTAPGSIEVKKMLPLQKLKIEGDSSESIRTGLLELITSLQAIKSGSFAAEFIGKSTIMVEEDRITFVQSDFPHYPIVEGSKAYGLLRDKVNMLFRLYFRDKKFLIKGLPIKKEVSNAVR